MANWTSPKSWTSELLTSADLNTYLRDNQTFSKEMAENAAVGCIFDGGGVAITTDSAYEVEVPGDATVLWATIRTDEAMDSDLVDSDTLVGLTVNVRRLASSDADNAFDSDDEIVTDLILDTDTGRYNKYTNTSDWTTSLTENDLLQFIVPSSAGITKVTVQLGVHKG